MKTELANWRRLGITLRTALLSWLVTIATLLSFICVILPQQRQTLQENLESRAHGLSSTLLDLISAAAISGDTNTVATQNARMLRKDPALDYLVVTPKDGCSLVYRRDRVGGDGTTVWSAERLPAAWCPGPSEERYGIKAMPPLSRRVFHFSQPIDYKGVQWGWLHVGLSIEGYDRSVAMVYYRTALVAVLCMQLSLLASIIYARRLLRPMLDLRSVVLAVAGGDLAVRARIDRKDELGSLAGAINEMTEALLRRDWILQSVRYAAQKFLTSDNWANVLDDVLGEVGRAADASRAYVFQNHLDERGRLVARQRNEWAAPGIAAQIANPLLQAFCYEEHDAGQDARLLKKGDIVTACVSTVPARQRSLLETQSILSLILIPIKVNGEWWGFLGLDDCRSERQWTDAERDSLRAAADMLGATLARQQVQKALVEAYENLEERVRVRTRELEEQVSAKETACSELARAQERLMEASRAAGKAEVATSVLHNVGNVLNSVSVSVGLVGDRLRQSKLANLRRATALLQHQNGQLVHFLTQDPKGKVLPDYLAVVSEQLSEEQTVISKELALLNQNIDHIKKIVTMQQSCAKAWGAVEDVHPAELIEDALRMNAGSFESRGIRVVREGDARLPRMNVDRHKVLLILINLLRNAKHALEAGATQERVLRVSLRKISDDMVSFVVSDNGVGIAPENLNRIFNHGFTTKKDGHGFGLHSGANAAREMGGKLTVRSDGIERGAEFTLELPVNRTEKATSS